MREAIKGLVSRNVLTVRQGSGTFVSHRHGVPNDPLGLTLLKQDRQLALELLEVRLILEPEIAALAATRATDGDLRRIVSQCDRVEKLILAEEEYQQEEGRSLLERLYGNSLPRLVASLHQGGAVGERELEELRRFLEEEGK